MVAMGLGRVGQPDVIFKRKFRWTLDIVTRCGVVVSRSFVKVAGRPKINVDSVEINYLNAVTWITGKAKWEPINITYYDVAGANSVGLLSWLASVYDFTSPVLLPMSERAGYAGTGTLTMYDGCGSALEVWQLNNMFPESIDFGDVDYESGDICTIELSCRYDSVAYASLCGGGVPRGCCVGC